MYRIVQEVYDSLLRERFPRKLAVCNGVTTRRQYLLDSIDKMPMYKESLCKSIERTVEDGDTVVLVGGGYGVSTVKAAEVGGEVRSFEASEELHEIVEECVMLNGAGEEVEVIHGIVGNAIEIDGDKGDAKSISPSDLTPCDVLILDCEGAERQILEEVVGSDVGKIVVETHTKFGSPPDLVREILDPHYSVVSSLPDRHRGDVNEEDKVITTT